MILLKLTDYLVDLGPEGGAGGGTIIASGTPEHIAKEEASYTGRYLKPILERDRERMKQLVKETESVTSS